MSKLKQLFPNHNLGDKHDYEIQQFTANDMIEFADSVAKEALKNASENAKTEQGYCSDGWTPSVRIVDKQSILSESNIPSI